MTWFVEVGKSFINASRIAEAQRSPATSKLSLYDHDGRFIGDTYDSLRPPVVVPAREGFFTVELADDDSAFRKVIVAWEIEDGIAGPITQDVAGDAFVLEPSGRVTHASHGLWNDIESWRRWMIESRDAGGKDDG